MSTAATSSAADSLRETPEGTEKRCTRCHDWWPADTDFFNRKGSGLNGLRSECKACQADYVNALRLARRQGGAAASCSA